MKCVITKAANTTSAHIVPYSLDILSFLDIILFKRLLENFRKRENKGMGADCFGDMKFIIDYRSLRFVGFYLTPWQTRTIDSLENLIPLCPEAHAYWEDRLFAIEPISVPDDKKMLHARFHWLCPRNLSQTLAPTALNSRQLGPRVYAHSSIAPTYYVCCFQEWGRPPFQLRDA